MDVRESADPTVDDSEASSARAVALAEYTTLKSEAEQRIHAQVTLVGFTLTAAAALSAVALSGGRAEGDASAPPRLLLLLIVPLVVNGLGMYFIQHNVLRSRITAYCRDELWPVIGGSVGIAGFDAYLMRTGTPRRAFFAIVVSVANLAVFTTSDVLALLLVREPAFATSSFAAAVWIIDVGLSALLVVAAAASSIEFGQPIDDALAKLRLGARSSRAADALPVAPCPDESGSVG